MWLNVLIAALLMAGCATAPEPYTPESTLRKLTPSYPSISVASAELPSTVKAIRGVTYLRHDGRSRRYRERGWDSSIVKFCKANSFYYSAEQKVGDNRPAKRGRVGNRYLAR